MVRSVRVAWGFGIATHAALVVGLEVGVAPTYLRAPRPTNLAGPPAEGWDSAAAQAALGRIWSPWVDEYRSALAQGELDGAWEVLASAAEAFLCARMGAPFRSERGGILAPQAATAFASRVGRAGVAMQPLATRLLRRLRTLENALRLWPEAATAAPAGAVARLEAVVRLARHWRHSEWAAVLVGPLDRVRLAHLLVQAREEYWEEERRAAAERRERFQDWLHASLASGGRKVFRWVAEPASQAPPPLFQLDGSWVGGPAAEVQALAPFWAPLWQKPDTPGAAEPALLEAVASLPPFPPWRL